MAKRSDPSPYQPPPEPDNSERQHNKYDFRSGVGGKKGDPGYLSKAQLQKNIDGNSSQPSGGGKGPELAQKRGRSLKKEL